MTMTEDARRLMGLRINDVRRQRGVSARELCARIEISESHLHNIERAQKCPSLDTVVALVQALDVSMDYIVLGVRPQFGGWGLVFREEAELKSMILTDD